jgi:4'-phosphopantetheinyl transferase
MRVRPRRRSLRDCDVHIYAADLDRATADENVLSEDELERAHAFRFERDRRRFVAGRTVLRRLLSGYLRCAPEEVEFLYGPYGKPSVREQGLSFNVAHSCACALFAFAPGFDVGIDVELAASSTDHEQIAERFFSPCEVATLRALHNDARPLAFLRCWTRKEAYIKARGEGLQLPLHGFDVAFAPAAPPALLRTAWSSVEPAEWALRDVSHFWPGAVAALAAHVPEVQVMDFGRID